MNLEGNKVALSISLPLWLKESKLNEVHLTDISISIAGLLNPEPKARPKSTGQQRKSTEQQTEFGFVNISNPSQASSREHTRFVKSFVRHQIVKREKGTRSARLEQNQLSASSGRADLEFIGDSQLEPYSSKYVGTIARRKTKNQEFQIQ